jgi:proline iminopeptidase
MRQYLAAVALLAFACAPPTSRAQHTAATKGIVHTSDVDLAYETLGSPGRDLPLIAINGGPGLTHVYMVQNNLWSRIARDREVVFYDQRGNGASKLLNPTAPQTMDAQVADLEALRAHLRVDKVDLLGDSFGGFVALAYTLAHPEHVHRLVISDGVPGWKAIAHPMPEIFPDLEEQEAAKEKELGDTPAAAQYGLRVHMRKCFYSPELADRYLKNIADLGFNPDVGNQVSKATADLDLSPQLNQVHTPTLILTGRFDVNVAPLTAWHMYKAIPGAQFHVFEHSGHLPSYEEPDAYFTTLTTFLDA